MKSQITAPLRSHARPVFDVAAAVFVQGSLVQLVTLVFGSLACVAGGADARGMTLPWQVLVGPAALAAGTAAGAALVTVLPHPWTIPFTAIGMFLAHRPFYFMGYPELFTLETATVPMPQARPIPAHLLASLGLNLVALVGCAALICHWTATAGSRPRWAVPLVGLAIVAGLAIFLPWWGNRDTYELL